MQQELLLTGSDEQAGIQQLLNLIGDEFTTLDGLGKAVTVGSRCLIDSKSNFKIKNLNLLAESGRPVTSLNYMLHAISCTDFKYFNCLIDANRANRTPAEVTAHSFAFDTCRNVQLELCRSLNAVVDGFHTRSIDNSDPADHCRDFTFINCKSDNSFRQGLSVIEGHNFTILNSEFTNTNGTAPAAGIDFESNAGVSPDAITNMKVDNCIFEGNEGFGVKIVSSNDLPRNLVFDNCEFKDNILGGVRISADGVTVKDSSFSGFTDAQERGMIEIPADTDTRNITIDNCSFSGFSTTLISKVCAYFHAVAGSDYSRPNFNFNNCKIEGGGVAASNVIDAFSEVSILNMEVSGMVSDSGAFVTLTNSKIKDSTFTDCTGRAIFMNENCIIDGVTLKDFSQGLSSNPLIHTDSSDTNWRIRNVYTSHATPITRVAIEIEAAGFELFNCNTNDDGGIVLDGTAATDTVSYNRQNTSNGVRLTESVITP